MRIGELASRSGVSERSLRYYETQRLLAPVRNAAGQRVYSPADVEAVIQIQELFAAGFCSTVIRGVLEDLASGSPTAATDLGEKISAAETRLEHEKRQVEEELRILRDFRDRIGVDLDMHVRADNRRHETQPASPTAFDHRDRRLR